MFSSIGRTIPGNTSIEGENYKAHGCSLRHRFRRSEIACFLTRLFQLFQARMGNIVSLDVGPYWTMNDYISNSALILNGTGSGRK